MSVWPTMDFMDSISSGIGSKGGANPFSYLARSQAQGERDVQKQAFEEDSALALENQERLINFENTHTLSHQVAGARAAGLSPLAALSGKVNFAPAGSASSASSSSPKGGSETIAGIMQGVSSLSSARLMNSQAELNEIEANRLKHEDSGADEGLRNFAQGLIDSGTLSDSDKDYWQSVVDNPSQYNVGDYKAQKNFQDAVVQRSDAVAKIYANEYEKELNIAYLRGDVPKWMAQIKRSEFFELSSKIAEIKAQTLLLDSNRDLNSIKSKELVAQINKLIKEAASIYHSDNVQLWKDGDFEALSVKVGEIALDAASKYLGFKGLSKSIRTAKDIPSSDFKPSIPKGIGSDGRKALTSKQAKYWAAERQRQLNGFPRF